MFLRTIEAARLLDVTPNTLREWERRFGFPISRMSQAGAREFRSGEVSALRDALQGGLSIPSAIARARATLAAENAEALYGAFASLDPARSAWLLDTSLRFRTLEGAVEDVLVHALDLVARQFGSWSRQWAFAADWATTWLRQKMEHAWEPAGSGSILLGRAVTDDLSPDAVYVLALELLCRLAGFTVQTMAADGPADPGDAILHRPRVLVLAGAQLPDRIVDRWACAMHQNLAPAAVGIFRRDPRSLPVFAPLATPLAENPVSARRELMALVDHAYPTVLTRERLPL